MSFNSEFIQPNTLNTLQENEEIKINVEELPLEDDDKCNRHVISPTKKGRKQGSKTKERSKKQCEPGKLMGHWNYLEKKRYHWFLEMYHEHFENKHMRRMDKIFKSMADFIGSRAADQCRSHHQKMEKKFKTFYNILSNLRMSNYGSIQTLDLKNQMEEQMIRIPMSLLEPNALTNQPPLENSQPANGHKEEVEYKVQRIQFNVEPEDNYMKGFDLMEEPMHQPLI